MPDFDHPVAPGDSLTVYLMTMGPGELVWERFGHNAIWIHDARTGEDVVWNWGLFSFSQSGFIPRLIRGEMMYWMGGFTLEQTLAEYAAAGRPVWVQELALTPDQERELDRLIRLNARPENVFYRYDYYRDNCSTRVRDMVDAALGGTLRDRFEGEATGTTWRWHTLRLLDAAPLPRLGVQLVLGNPGDESIDRWQEMFLPMRLREAVAEVQVAREGGGTRPLVVRETMLLEAAPGRSGGPAAPRNLAPLFLLAGLIASAGVLALGALGRRGSAAARRALALVVGVWGVVGGVVGCILAGAYFTDHVFWYANENLLQASPLHLLVGTAGLMLLFRRTLPRWGRRVVGGAAGLAALGLVLKALPGFDQGNLEIVAFALPLNLAVAWALLRVGAASGGARAAERVDRPSAHTA